MRKWLLLCCLMLSPAMPLPAAAADKPVELVFLQWAATENTMKSIYDVIADFEKENPDIKIVNTLVGVGEIRNQLMMMIMGGNAPDVAQLDIGDAVTVYSMGALHPVEDVFDADFIENMNPVFYDEGRVGDKHAAVNWAPNTITFYTNKKLLQQLGYDAPPKTMEEMEAMMKKGKAEIPNFIGFQLDSTVRTVGLLNVWPLMNIFEYKVIDGQEVHFNGQNMVAFGEWLRRMVNDGYTLPGKRFGEFRPMAAQGRVLFCIDGTIHRGHMKAFNAEIDDATYAETWEASPMPLGPGGKHVAGPDDHSLVVLKSTEHKEAAARFVRYLTESKSALTKYHDPIGFLPPVKNYKEIAPGCFEDAGRQGSLQFAVPNIVNMPYGPNFVKAALQIMTCVQEIITTDKPIQSILDEYQLKLEGILQ
jgi:multiple sugar transport system substrate-binding protein